MKVFLLFLALGIHAMNSVAQTASASFGDGISSSSVGSGTGRVEDRIESESATHTPFEFREAHAAALPEPALILPVPNDSDMLFSTSRGPDYGLLADVQAPNDPSTSRVPEDDYGGASKLAGLPAEPPHPDTRIHWKAANGEGLLSTGIMHTFNLWTEAGTRDALYGPWAADWLRSVGELRGWSDSDRFVAPYVGHSIQGSIFGYILRQNDPKYRDVQWGDGRDYFMSLLRSMAFSAVWHTQWKIGVASEDSIGNVMLHASPGFITLVDTPTLGTVTMIGEDALDLRLADDRNRHEPFVERDMRIVKHRPDLNRDPASHFSDFGGWIGRTLLSGLCLSVLRSFFGNGLVFNNLRMTFSNSDLLKLSSVIGCFTKTVSGANPENHF